MKTPSSKVKVKAFTLVEVLVVIAVLLLLAVLLLPALPHGVRIRGNVSCMNNLKQVDLASIMYASDYNEQFPWQISSKNGGTMEYVSSGQTSPHFRKLSNYGSNLPNRLVCPADKVKTVATNVDMLTDQNISYFLNVDAPFKNKPALTFLAGDRNLQMNGQAVKPGLFVLTTNLDMSWTREIHPSGGSLAFADGHVEFVQANNLNSIVQQQPLATNRLCIP